jgi:hypothetical protein
MKRARRIGGFLVFVLAGSGCVNQRRFVATPGEVMERNDKAWSGVADASQKDTAAGKRRIDEQEAR